MSYRNRNVLITGGLGFLGSTLAIRLAGEGARVTIVDSLVRGCGGNPYNIDPVRESVRCLSHDISQPSCFVDEIRETEVIFNLAGEISHLHSMDFPERDLEINALAQLRFLLACRDAAPGVRMIYSGTRQVYGAPEYLPVDEEHPINPVDFNGVHKYAATMYHLMLARSGHLDAVVLRFTNIYGPRLALDAPCQGFLSAYLRTALLGERLDVFGDGQQLRDPVYVDDAVQALVIAGAAGRLPSRTYNVGGPEALSVLEMAQTFSRLAGLDPPLLKPFPEDRKAIDIGSYSTDSTRIQGELGWSPAVRFAQGIALTLDYYRDRMPHYLDPNNPHPTCKLREPSATPRKTNLAAV